MKRNVIVAVGALCVAATGLAVGSAQDRPQQRPPTGQTPMQQQPMQQPPTQPRPGTGTQAQTEMCPVGIQGLQVQAMTIPEGGALQFTVAPDQVNELRTRLQRFAQMHRQHMQQPGATGGAATGAPRSGTTTGGAAAGGQPRTGAAAGGAQAGQQAHFADMNAMIHQAQDLRVVEIPNGARLEVRMSRAPEQRVEDLRNELRQDAQQMTQGRCPLALQMES